MFIVVILFILRKHLLFFFFKSIHREVKKCVRKRKVVIKVDEKNAVSNEELKKRNFLSNVKTLKNNGERTNNFKNKEGNDRRE